MSVLHIRSWVNVDAKKAQGFLEKNYASSMFLLGNLFDKGPTLTDHPNSGNFKVLLEGEKILGVFCLTLRGNLLLTLEQVDETIFSLVLSECKKESIQFKGVLGGWQASNGFWSFLKNTKEILSSSVQSKEILYRLDEIKGFEASSDVRYLDHNDYSTWRPLRIAYDEELGLGHELSEEDTRKGFLKAVKEKEYWGLFQGETLVSTAALNTKTLDIGQVGGVYTLPEYRGKGLSQKTMRQLLHDCATDHKITRIILFTGEENHSAQKVYENLGFERIGYFGMFFV